MSSFDDKEMGKAFSEGMITRHPPTMSNAEAIEVLENIETDIYGRIAISKAIDALRVPWVKTSDRPPTEADADSNGDILVYDPIDEKMFSFGYKSVEKYPASYLWWMSIPPLPEKEEQEPWLGDDLDCPNCGAMLELIEGGMLACHLCGFADNDTAEVEG